MKRKISVSIPCYNSSDFILNVLEYPVTDNRIDEIIVVDDGSKDYAQLEKRVNSIKSSKIRLFRNEVNSGGAFMNKGIAASYAKNDWVLIFDSDNVFDESFINSIFSIHEWDENKFYSPNK